MIVKGWSKLQTCEVKDTHKHCTLCTYLSSVMEAYCLESPGSSIIRGHLHKLFQVFRKNATKKSAGIIL
jgi:hypothetical protein